MLAGGIYWLTLPSPSPVLAVTSISNIEFHEELRQVGFDGPSPPGAFRALTWNDPARTEQGVTAAVRSLDLTPTALASGPRVDFVSMQSSIHAREPVLNTILGWSNDNVDLWILRQRHMVPGGYWRTYGIAQDKTARPNVAFFFEVTSAGLEFRGESCYVCHASGPRLLRPLRPDLVDTESVEASFNRAIELNGVVATHFSTSEPATPRGPALAAPACVPCHHVDGDRAPLYRVHEESIRALVATAAMPRRGQLSPAEAAEIERWMGAH